VLGVFILHKWDSPLHFLIPIPGFFLAFWLFSWVEVEFGVSRKSVLWPAAIIVLGLAAFFVAQAVYWCNGLTDIYAANTTCSADGMANALSLVGGQWQDLLLRDGYFYFVLMTLLAWGAVQVLESLSPMKNASARPKKAPLKKDAKK
jgi:hypothetical protein